MYIVADIGGSKMRVARSRDLSSFEEPVIIETPQVYDDGLIAFVNLAKKTLGDETVEGIVIGIPGVLSTDKKCLARMPHLPQWQGRHLVEDLEGRFFTKVLLQNDTALVGLGEAVAGAGRDASIVAYITVSTGVGGARIVDGIIDRAAIGFEVGGQYVLVGDTPTTLEDLVSGTAVTQKYGKHPKELGKDWAGWEELAKMLAFGVHNTILHWSPDRVVLGGSMFNDIGIPIERVRAHVQEIMKKFPTLPDIVHSGLGDVGGLHGGLAYLKQVN